MFEIIAEPSINLVRNGFAGFVTNLLYYPAARWIITDMSTESQKDHGVTDVFIDAHVHFYDCYSLPEFFNSARDNFTHAAVKLGLGDQFQSVLLLTEGGDANLFQQLREKSIDETAVDGWRIRETGEPDSVIASSATGFDIIVIAGRQIVTIERMEVLAVCTDALFEDGQKITDAIDAVIRAGGIAILPWGFGKWMGRRKRIIDRLLKKQDGRLYHLGDNSGRTWTGPEPAQFRNARSSGKLVLRGTDPLPFRGEEKRVGKFGFHLRGPSPWMDLGPAASVRQMLTASQSLPVPYGKLERPVTFIRHQLKMQIRKMRNKVGGTAI